MEREQEGADAQAVIKGVAQAGASRLVGGRLLDLEGRLPPEGALCCTAFQLWQAWRRGVEHAASPSDLIPQVRAREGVPSLRSGRRAITTGGRTRSVAEESSPAGSL